MDNYEKAILAGGCFWCTEADFEKLPGVISAVSGYIGGHVDNPTYEEVCSGSTGHLEAVEITFDPNKISFEKILDYFWKHIDPTDPYGQFVDQGSQYKSAIFYLNEKQREIAEKSKDNLQKNGPFKEKIATAIRKVEKFYPAEEYHQDFWKKSQWRYNSYRNGSGRDLFRKQHWKE